VIEEKFVDLYARNSGLRDKLVAERDGRAGARGTPARRRYASVRGSTRRTLRFAPLAGEVRARMVIRQGGRQRCHQGITCGMP